VGVVKDSRTFSGNPYIERIQRSSFAIAQLSFLILLLALLRVSRLYVFAQLSIFILQLLRHMHLDLFDLNGQL